LRGANPETGPAPLQGLALRRRSSGVFRQEGRNQGGSPGGVERHHRDIGAAAVRLKPRQRISETTFTPTSIEVRKAALTEAKQF